MGITFCIGGIFCSLWEYSYNNHISKPAITQANSFSLHEPGSSRSSGWITVNSTIYCSKLCSKAQPRFPSSRSRSRYDCWVRFHFYPDCNCIGANVCHWLAVSSSRPANPDVYRCYSNPVDNGVCCDPKRKSPGLCHQQIFSSTYDDISNNSHCSYLHSLPCSLEEREVSTYAPS